MGDDKGFWERLYDRLDSAADVDERVEKVPGGFRPEVCEGCPHHQTEKVGSPCALCGCPTFRGGTLDKFQRTPEGCPREDEHKR